MDKKTLSNYGWIVAVILILSIMIALATPFAMAVKNGVVGAANGFVGHANGALKYSFEEHTWESMGGGSDLGDNSGGEQLPAGGEVSEAGEILDSWEVIINNVNNGTYSTKYAVGNYKPLDLGSEGVVNMQIAALDTDIMSDGSGNAHITWIAKELLATKHNMNSTKTNANGWEASEMRTYLQTDIWALIDPTVQNAIVAVDKTYYDHTTSSTKTCSDKVWIPSYREVGFGTGVENDGIIYSELFTDNASRIKYQNGTASSWWLRSARTVFSDHFYDVFPDGNWNSNYTNFTYGVALSFCF